MNEMMRLTVLTPEADIVDEPVLAMTAVSTRGSLGILPRHIDIVAPLVPAILSYLDTEANEHHIAVDVGTLAKTGPGVRVATRRAVRGVDLASLEHTVREEFVNLSERERDNRLTLAKLEAGIVRRFIEFEGMRPG